MGKNGEKATVAQLAMDMIAALPRSDGEGVRALVALIVSEREANREIAKLQAEKCELIAALMDATGGKRVDLPSGGYVQRA